jgi:hypothetical protein
MIPQTITSFSPFSVRYSSRPLSFLNARAAYSLDEPFFSQQRRKPGIDLEFIVSDGKACTGPIVMLDIDDLDSLFAGSPDQFPDVADKLFKRIQAFIHDTFLCIHNQ